MRGLLKQRINNFYYESMESNLHTLISFIYYFIDIETFDEVR